MNKCARCHIEKDNSDFKTNRINGKIYLGWCKQCNRIYQIERARKLGVLPKIKKTISIPEEKVCSCCNVKMSKENFRVRFDKRRDFTYLNNTCLVCEAKLTAERVKRQRSTPEGKAMHNKWAREFHRRHRKKVLEYGRKRRQTPEYKAYMKAYREKNKEKIKAQEQITKRRYLDKHKNSVSDEYAIRSLVAQGYGNRKEIEANRELIEIKKVKILTKRLRMQIINKKRTNERHSKPKKSSI